ncbi:hypothetical protein HPB51_025953 [Rhipicephalus microplus]|uniref:ribonuclease H n=1 Tax=Rhipicephalus microplus TaxID=6941 RepID=A0A9J6EDS9_RHIMP|nr:hypothetical protein HPB51_025953 [Rhipicephalus microplus]
MVFRRLLTVALGLMPKKGQFYYAVRNGRQKGVFLTWPECESQVKGYPRPVYKKFSTEQEAWAFLLFLCSGAFGVSCHSVGKALQGRKRKHGSDPVEEQRDQRFCPDPNEPTDMLHVYTDGACTHNGGINGTPRAAIGVYWGPNHPMNVSERLPGQQTNNRAEIHAAVRALQQVRSVGGRHVTIYTDSSFLINNYNS